MQRTVVQRGVGCSEQAARRQALQRQQPARRQPSVIVRASGSSEDEVARLLAETKALANNLSTAAASPAIVTDPADVPEGMELRCDVNGCTIVPISSDEDLPMGPAGSMVASVDEGEYGDVGLVDFFMAEGDGWKLGVDRAEVVPTKYCAAIGSNSFTAALTLAEHADFCKLLQDLQRSVQTMQSSGGGDWKATSSGSDEAALEVSTERVWLQGRAASATLQALQAAWSDGKAAPKAFSLRFIFTGTGTGREVSGVWSATAVAEALRSLDSSVEASSVPSEAVPVSK